jgi:hypothetical protein
MIVNMRSNFSAQERKPSRRPKPSATKKSVEPGEWQQQQVEFTQTPASIKQLV